MCEVNYALFGLVVYVGHPGGVKKAVCVNVQHGCLLSRDDGGGWVGVGG